MKRSLVAALAAASCVLFSGSALAAVVTVSEGGSVIASWDQSLTPTPVDYGLGVYTSVTISDPVGVVGPVAWYNTANSGGVTDYDGGLNILSPQVYTGPESAPIFQPGTWLGTDENNSLATTITISVPEPATWAMMLVGLGLVGFVARRRRTVSVKYA